MKIATHINKLFGGGAERVAANLSFFLNQKFNHFFILHSKTEETYPYSGQIFYTDFSKKKVSSLFRFFRRMKTLRKAKNELTPQVVISHLFSPNQSNILSQENDKTIVVIHGKASLYKNALERQLAKRNYKKANAIVTISKHYKQRVVNEFKIEKQKVHCIHNPISVEEILQSVSEPIDEVWEQELFKKPVFINVGRINNVKGQWHAIRSFSEVVAHNPDAQLVFIGRKDEQLTPYLDQLVKDYNLTDNVHFLGHRSNPFKYMFHSYCYFSTSIREGFPMVILEALACDLPIIATDCDSGPREILAPNTNFSFRTKDNELAEFGILTPACDGLKLKASEPITKEESCLADAVRYLLDNPNLKSTFQQGMKEYINKFDVSSIGKQYEALIYEVLNEEILN